MSFGSRRGSGSPATAADAPDGVVNHGLVDLPAADLVAHLIRCNSRASDFVDVALVLAARERRLVEAEAKVRAAADVAARRADEITALESYAAEADAKIHLASEREAKLRAEIREWQRKAAEAEARLQAYVDDDREHEGLGAEIAARDDVPGSSSLMLSTGGAALPDAEPPVLQAAELQLHGHGTMTDVVIDLTGDDDDDDAQAAGEGRGEEVPLLMVVSGKRKKYVVSSEDDGKTSPRQRSKKLKRRGGRFANAIDEAEAQEEEGCDLPEASLGIGGGDVPEERTRSEPPAKHGDEDISVEAAGDYESGGDQVPYEPETGVLLLDYTQVSPAAAVHSGASGGSGSAARRRNGKYYKMVFGALKENEKKMALGAAVAKPAAATAAASQPKNLICVLYAPLPKDSVTVEDGPDDKDEPQQ